MHKAVKTNSGFVYGANPENVVFFGEWGPKLFFVERMSGGLRFAIFSHVAGQAIHRFIARDRVRDIRDNAVAWLTSPQAKKNEFVFEIAAPGETHALAVRMPPDDAAKFVAALAKYLAR